MRLTQADLEALIPHTGTMCLLKDVVEWDDARILCTADSHRDSANPLRRDERLAAVHGLEYGAQAMAVHGALLARAAGGRLGGGYLAATRELRLAVDYLEDVAEPLQVLATRLFASGDNLMYEFELSARGRVLVSGRATVAGRPA